MFYCVPSKKLFISIRPNCHNPHVNTMIVAYKYIPIIMLCSVMSKELDELVEVDLPPSDSELIANGLFGYEIKRPVVMTKRDYNVLVTIHRTALAIVLCVGVVMAYNQISAGIEREGSFQKWYEKVTPDLDEMPNWNF